MKEYFKGEKVKSKTPWFLSPYIVCKGINLKFVIVIVVIGMVVVFGVWNAIAIIVSVVVIADSIVVVIEIILWKNLTLSSSLSWIQYYLIILIKTFFKPISSKRLT